MSRHQWLCRHGSSPIWPFIAKCHCKVEQEVNTSAMIAHSKTRVALAVNVPLTPRSGSSHINENRKGSEVLRRKMAQTQTPCIIIGTTDNHMLMRVLGKPCHLLEAATLIQPFAWSTLHWWRGWRWYSSLSRLCPKAFTLKYLMFQIFLSVPTWLLVAILQGFVHRSFPSGPNDPWDGLQKTLLSGPRLWASSMHSSKIQITRRLALLLRFQEAHHEESDSTTSALSAWLGPNNALWEQGSLPRASGVKAHELPWNSLGKPHVGICYPLASLLELKEGVFQVHPSLDGSCVRCQASQEACQDFFGSMGIVPTNLHKTLPTTPSYKAILPCSVDCGRHVICASHLQFLV